MLLALAPPGSVTATPAAAITPAAPAVIVIVRSLDWCRSRAAIAASREPGRAALGWWRHSDPPGCYPLTSS